ncbi:hypothetical protein FHS68_005201 [Dyadobacter arcticus]|uniref:Uncharacterized protein n=1 Tax=Dyadobacter arcticus TaxID=1078754 RepID=A0ABX0USQ7_9BACT|nr:hypothetical protein [Dyadobacter arcticus]
MSDLSSYQSGMRTPIQHLFLTPKTQKVKTKWPLFVLHNINCAIMAVLPRIFVIKLDYRYGAYDTMR